MHFISFPFIFTTLSILAVISFFFAVAETSIIGLSKIKLRHMLAKGLKHAPSIQRLIAKLDKFIAAILIGNNFVNIAMSAIITVLFVHFMGERLGIILATLVSATTILTLCEITPKILATKHTERCALFIAPIMEVFIKIINPLIKVFMTGSGLILKLLRIQPAARSPLITEEELRLMIEVGKEEGVLSAEEQKMLHRVFEFGDIKIEKVMISKDKIVAAEITASLDHLVDLLIEEGHARIPVYLGSIDKIVGILYARDLLYILKDNSLFVVQDILTMPYYVGPDTKVNDLLRIFQKEKIQIAIVVDKHKNTLGLVTMEDLLEEIVGEIEQESSSVPVRPRKDPA